MLLLFLLQLSVIVASSQVLGRISGKLGQPAVIGEIVAGIMLGPSLLGWLAPGLQHALFPEASLGLLNLMGQLGVVLFMFVVGLTLRLDHLREQYNRALLIGFSCIALPFVLGVLLASLSFERLSNPGVSLPAFALFLGVCMSITAFPVLARILRETGMGETRLGAVAIACAAVGGVIAWIILAAILAFVRLPAQHWPLSLTFVFGAFFAGAVMPRKPRFVEAVRRMIEPLTAAVLLPPFFALTGLRTRFSLAIAGDAWIYTILIVAVAVAGKWLGAFLVGRWMGMSHREANALGILMNARGLVELVILNIGFELGILSPTVFSMMVIMALVTTFMTAPLVRWVYPANLWPDEGPLR